MAKKNQTSLTPAKVEQPFQLELFRLTDAPKTNTFDFYEAIPRFLVGGDESRYVKPDGSVGKIHRNSDGTAQPIERLYEYDGRRYILTIVPAAIKQKDGSFKSVFPGVREEIIEFIVHKLAVEQGFFTGEGTQDDKFAVFTNTYRIQQELKKRKGKKHPSYNYKQIMEAIQVLSGCRITLKGQEKGEEWNLSPFSERISQDEDQRIHDKIKESVTLYLELNSLIRRDIIARQWRQIPYENIMQEESYLARWFRKLLSRRFTYAQLGRNYNILLSTVINTSGISPYKELRHNLAYVKRTLEGMDIVSNVTIEQEMEVNPETNRKRIKDALLKIYPTKQFVSEIIGANVHHKSLDDAKEDIDGLPLIEPKRSGYRTPQEYEDARQKYASATIASHKKRYLGK